MKVGASALLDGEGRVLTGTPASALGALFESLATLTVRVCAQTAEAATSHLRTERGEHEVDLIVERHDGHVLGIEVKLAASIDDKDVRHLHWLAQHHGPRVQDLIVLTTGPHAYRRPDGIAVVPLPSDSSAPEAEIFPEAGEPDVERGATATGSARLRMFGEALLVGVVIGTSGSTGSTAAKTAQAPAPAAPAAAFSDGVHLIRSDIQQVK